MKPTPIAAKDRSGTDSACMQPWRGQTIAASTPAPTRLPRRECGGIFSPKQRTRRRLAKLSEGDDIKSLREEMSLVTMMIEEQWNTANTPLERQQMHAHINTLLQTLDKLTRHPASLKSGGAACWQKRRCTTSASKYA